MTIPFSSCYTYKIFPKEYRDFRYTGEKGKAFILNPKLIKEYNILKESGIYIFTNDSSADSTIKIKLLPIHNRIVCGEGILASWITLGQVPVLFPDRYQYAFNIIQKTDTIQMKFELQIATRIWFWDIFSFNKKFDRKAGQALMCEYYNGKSQTNALSIRY